MAGSFNTSWSHAPPGDSSMSRFDFSQSSIDYSLNQTLAGEEVDEVVTQYVAHCAELRIDPVLEFVVALSSSNSDGQPVRCILSQRKKPLTDQDLCCISEALRGAQIEEIDLSDNSITQVGVTDLAAALRVSSRLQLLALSNNDIRSEGALTLAAGLKDAPSLASLNVSNNSIMDTGLAALSEALSGRGVGSPGLCSLVVDRNRIGDHGISCLASALKCNGTLREFSACSNIIGDEGTISLAGALKSNTSLTSLSLGENRIGVAGARALASCLSTSSSIEHLNLSSNPLQDAGLIAIAESLPWNTSLTYLNVSDCEASPSAIATFLDAARTKQTLNCVIVQGMVYDRRALSGFSGPRPLSSPATPNTDPRDSAGSFAVGLASSQPQPHSSGFETMRSASHSAGLSSSDVHPVGGSAAWPSSALSGPSMAEVQKQLADISNTLRDSKEKYSSLDARVEKLEKEFDERAKGIVLSDEDIAKKFVTQEGLEGSIQKLANDALGKKFQSQVDRLRAEVSERATLDAVDERVLVAVDTQVAEQLSRSLSSHTRRVAAAETRCTEELGRFETLLNKQSRQLDLMDDKLREAERKHKDADSKHSTELQNSLSSLRQSVHALEDQVQGGQAESVSVLATRLDALSERLTALESKGGGDMALRVQRLCDEMQELRSRAEGGVGGKGSMGAGAEGLLARFAERATMLQNAVQKLELRVGNGNASQSVPAEVSERIRRLEALVGNRSHSAGATSTEDLEQGMRAIARRLQTLENMVRQDQETSMQALEAILKDGGVRKRH